MELDRHEPKVHDGTKLVAKKKLEKKFLGAGVRPYKGARLWALNMETRKIYEIHLQTKKAQKVKGLGSKKDEITAKHEVHVNPEHPLRWALNRKVALKKFLKMKFRV